MASNSALTEPTLIQPAVHGDARGFFVETWREEQLPGVAFVQANQSRSARGVLRGLHFQVGRGIAKYVRCARGSIFDVAVDVRPGSPTFGHWQGWTLDDERHHAVLVPVGFAHGFVVLSEVADVVYMQDGYYDPAAELGVVWDDPEIGVQWPLDGIEPLVSDRDAAAPRLSEIADSLHFDR